MKSEVTESTFAFPRRCRCTLTTQNYEVTMYIAEFWNSVSNLFFIIPPLAVCIKLWRRNVERVYILALIYMAFTGIGSFAFHATLKYPMQLWDELSMVWSAIFVLYLVVKMHWPAQADRAVVGMIVYGLFTNAVYLWLPIPVIFQVAYAILHYSVLYLCYRLIDTHVCDPRLFYGTLAAHHIAFLLWNIDNNMCGLLERLRESLPAACTPFTQLHAVWHFLAGYGSFALVLFCIQARLLSQERAYYVNIDGWSGLTLDEAVGVPIEKWNASNGKAAANGHANGKHVGTKSD